MNGLKVFKKQLVVGSSVVVGAVGVAGTASAALDLTPITTAIGTAVTDITAAGLILVGAHASVWVIKELVTLFKK